METKFTTLEANEREVEISLTAADLQPHYEAAYKRAQKDIEIKGFRKGHVPIGMIQQRFGRQIEIDALEDIASAEFRRAAQDNALQVVGQPSLRDIRREQDGSIVFIIRYETLPEFELGEYRNIAVQKPVHSVGEEDVQREIEAICLRAAALETAEQVSDYMHVVRIKLNNVDEASGAPMIGAEAQETQVFLDAEDLDPDLREPLLNTKVGDTFQYRPPQADDENASPLYRVEVAEIQKVVPAEFTNELVEKLTDGRLTSTEQLREEIEGQLRQLWEQEARRAMEDQVVTKLVEAHDFTLPPSLLHDIKHTMAEDYLKRNQIQGVDPHSIEGQFDELAVKVGKWELIRNRIAEAENIELKEEDLQPVIEQYLSQTKLSEEQVRNFVLRNTGVLNQVLAEKVMKTLLDYAVVDEVQVAAPEA